MTPTDLAEAVRLARELLAAPDGCVSPGWLPSDARHVARALVAADDALVAISKALRLGDYTAPFEYVRASAEEIATEARLVANAASQYDTAIARAERAEAALAAECDEADCHLAITERARVVEEIAAWHEAEAAWHRKAATGALAELDKETHIDFAGLRETAAYYIRKTWGKA